MSANEVFQIREKFSDYSPVGPPGSNWLEAQRSEWRRESTDQVRTQPTHPDFLPPDLEHDVPPERFEPVEIDDLEHSLWLAWGDSSRIYGATRPPSAKGWREVRFGPAFWSRGWIKDSTPFRRLVVRWIRLGVLPDVVALASALTT